MKNAMQRIFGLALILFSITALADSQGVGAVLKHSTQTYENSNKGKLEFKMKAGVFFAFFKGMTWGDYKSENGFVRVAFFENNDSGREKTTWIPESELEFFQFSCVEGAAQGFSVRSKSCLPIQTSGFKHQWTLEFKLAARNKCKELNIAPAPDSVILSEAEFKNLTAPVVAPAASSASSSAPQNDPSQMLTNADVIKMTQAGMDSNIIIMKIKSGATHFDLTTDGLIALSNAKVSQDVIKAMMDSMSK